MKDRKKIGVFIGRPDEPFQTRLLKALGRELFQYNMDVLVFSNLLRTGGYEDYQVGEARIMELVNYDMLDAVIVVPDSLQMMPDYAGRTAQLIRRNFDGIRVSIDMEEPGYEMFACDDTAGVCEVIAHLIEVHGCTDIAFMTGPKEHPHSQARLEGYRRALLRAGLAVDEERIFYGDFWYDEGERVVAELLESEKGLPQAVACGSDTMAVSVCRALQRRDIRVPEDILVTGFDCETAEDSEAAFITSAVRGIDETAEKAARYIAAKLGAEQRRHPFQKKSNLRLYQSCSCGRRFSFGSGLPDKREDDFFALYNFMQERLLMAKNLTDCLWEIDGCAIHAGKFDKMYICLSPDWSRQDERNEGEHSLGGKMLLALNTAAEPEKKTGVRVSLDCVFDTKDMLPALVADREEPRMFYFNMLHFGRHCFGYIVLEYSGADCVYDRHYPFWVRKVNAALESLRRVYALNDLYEEAERKAITDAMTGLYNRNGYSILLPDIIEKLGEDESLFFMLCDNNGLKYINDTYGHIAGDEVIRLSAEILSKSYFDSERELNFRIGGDEYVKLVAGKLSRQQAEACIASIRRQVERINASQECAYPLYLAIGFRIYKKSEIESVDQIMKEADALMYHDKQRLKRVSGFDPVRKE